MAIKFDYQSLENTNKVGRHTDPKTKGLQLLIKKNGKKYWVLRFSYLGKRHEIGFGSFPDVSIKLAREMAYEQRIKLIQGINPLEIKQKDIKAKLNDLRRSVLFKDFAITCIDKKKDEWRNSKHADQWRNTLEQYAFPIIGNLNLSEINTSHILMILNPIWKSKTETASRLRGRLEWILASATTQNFREGMNPALWKGHLQTILPIPNKISPVEHHAALPYKEIPSFFSKLHKNNSLSALALEFLILNASRTSEVTLAKKSEICDGIWTIPAFRMKNYKEHKVPLCKRSIEILSKADLIDPNSQYLFSKNGKHLSNMAMLSLLKKMEPNITVHGFRSTFRDWVSEETHHSPEVAEKSLAHTIHNEVERSYRRGDLLQRRRLLMNDWESYCLYGRWNNVIKLPYRHVA
ncbi:MAG: site-specific integrase [Burkholderiaceae bacterium]|nr:site-specific integrase [Burkholderiaceae bacterium]